MSSLLSQSQERGVIKLFIILMVLITCIKGYALQIIHKRLKKLTVPDLHSIWALTVRSQEKDVGQEFFKFKTYFSDFKPRKSKFQLLF